MTNDTLTELVKAKAIFQQKAILAAMGVIKDMREIEGEETDGEDGDGK